jgi:arylsulfatase A-like enzyme
VARAFRLDLAGTRRLRWLRTAFLALALANLAGVGLIVLFQAPGLTPMPWRLGALVAALAVVVAFIRYSEDDQRIVMRALYAVGGVALVVPLLAVPPVAMAAAQDVPRLKDAPAFSKAPQARPTAPKRIVLVSFDALALGATSLADPTLDTTPTLSALQRESTYFQNFRAAGGRTQVAVPTLLTGVSPFRWYPENPNKADVIREGFMPSLAGHLAHAGYRSRYATMGINPLLFGLDGEFERGYSNASFFGANRFNTASYLPIGEAFAWLTEKASGQWTEFQISRRRRVEEIRHTFAQATEFAGPSTERTFVWVHLGAPHTPFLNIAKADLDKPLKTLRYDVIGDTRLHRANAAELREIAKAYRNYVRFVDHELGRFVADLKARGLWEDTLFVVTSDHGESFDTAHPGHANGHLPEDITRVPLLIHLPGQSEAATRTALAGHEDLVPTVLSQVYDEAPGGLAGTNLLAPDLPANRAVRVWELGPRDRNGQTGPASAALYTDRYKYAIQYMDPAKGAQVEALYDVVADPQARHDLARTRPEVLAALRPRIGPLP